MLNVTDIIEVIIERSYYSNYKYNVNLNNVYKDINIILAHLYERYFYQMIKKK